VARCSFARCSFARIRKSFYNKVGFVKDLSGLQLLGNIYKEKTYLGSQINF
jgi:hypothetical protein